MKTEYPFIVCVCVRVYVCVCVCVRVCARPAEHGLRPTALCVDQLIDSGRVDT